MQVSVATEEHTQMETNQPPVYRVIIIDGMVVVNSVTKTSNIKTCQDFADSFLAIICNMAANCDEVRLVFDRYMQTSLKEQMRAKQTKGKSTYYHVKDNTLIKNISLKNFLKIFVLKQSLLHIWLRRLYFTAGAQTTD